jgi:hypothetical protein
MLVCFNSHSCFLSGLGFIPCLLVLTLSFSRVGLEVVIGVNGWLWKREDSLNNFSVVREVHPGAELYSLAWQTEELLALGRVGLINEP